MDGYLLFRILISFLLSSLIQGQTLEVPSAGNCRENINIYCRHSSSCSQWNFYKDGSRIYTSSSKYSVHEASSYTRLTVHSMAMSDQGSYRCDCSSYRSNSPYLNYECRPTSMSTSVTSAKKMSLSFSGAYPQPNIAVSVNSGTISGRSSCRRSSDSHYSCNWASDHSLGYGSNSYVVTVRTVSSRNFQGSLRVASPRSPAISSLESVSPFGHIVRGYEDREVRLVCTSRGGIPAPMVSWNRGGSELTKTSAGSRQADGTYTVSLTYSFTARRSDDLQTYTCKSMYPGATSHAAINLQQSSAKLYLYLKPSQPTITQVNTLVNGGLIQFKCKTTGSRPAPSIEWNFRGSSSSATVQSTEDGSKISTATSTFKQEVSVVDNGKTVTCIVRHPAVSGDLRSSVGADIKFAVRKDSTVISGNTQMTLTLSNSLDLTCTTGSSNPASTITWMNGSLVIPSTNPYTSKIGTNNGVIRTQVLTLTLTRYMDGDLISCDVTNDDEEVAADQGDAVTDTVVLDILYPPEVQSSPTTIYAYEGNHNFVLPCIVTSKPQSAFWWYRLGIDPYILRHPGFSLVRDFYSYNFTFPMVVSADGGEYRCKADNGIGVVYSPYIRFIVKYLRLSVPESIFAGQSASFNYTLYDIDKSTVVKPWVHEWPNHGEVKKYTYTHDFVLTNLGYQHSGTYTISVKERSQDAIFLTRTATLFVKSPPVIITPIITHGRHTFSAKLGSRVYLDIQYYSNVAGDHVKLFKKHNGAMLLEDQASVSLTPVTISLPVLSTVIETTGTLCSVAIYIKREEDYGDFDIVISNGVGTGTVFPVSIKDAGFEMSSAHISILVGGMVDILAAICVVYLIFFLKRRKLNLCGKKKALSDEKLSRSFKQLEEITETDADEYPTLSAKANESTSSNEDTENGEEDDVSENGIDNPIFLAVSNEHYSSSFQQLNGTAEVDIDNISALSMTSIDRPNSSEDTDTDDEDNPDEKGIDVRKILGEHDGETSSQNYSEYSGSENENSLSENGADGRPCPSKTEDITAGSVDQIEKTIVSITDSTVDNLPSVEPRQYQKLEANATMGGAYQQLNAKVADVPGKAPGQYETLDAKAKGEGAYQKMKSEDKTGQTPRQYETLDAKTKDVGPYQQIKSEGALIGPKGSKYENLEIKTFSDKSNEESVSSPPGLYEQITPSKPDHIYESVFPQKRRMGFLFGLFRRK